MIPSRHGQIDDFFTVFFIFLLLFCQISDAHLPMIGNDFVVDEMCDDIDFIIQKITAFPAIG